MILGSHVIRYGAAFNHLQGGGFASFFRNAPYVPQTWIRTKSRSGQRSFPRRSVQPTQLSQRL
jgi:hypothetical protein